MASQPSLACVLCFSVLIKASDRNLVANKGEFLVKREIDDLHFVVHSTSQHICRACLGILKQRRNHKTKLDDLNEKLLRQYREKAGTKGLGVKTKGNAKRSLSFVDESESQSTSSCPEIVPVASCCSEHLTENPTLVSPFQPRSTSTPTRATRLPQHEADNFSTAQTTIVSVKVQWRSKTATRTLPKDLCSIGKMLCRGTYTQIARAAWRCEKVREQTVVLFLKEINRECSNMCSKKSPSILRKTSKEDIVNFSLTKLDHELKERTPLLRSVLMSASIRKSSLQRSNLYWMPAVCMASSICLKNRSPYLTVLQLLNTIFIQHSGLMAILCRLRVLRLVVSHTFLYKKLDEFGHNHNAKILEKVNNENARLLQIWNDNHVHGSEEVTPSEQLEADQGRKIVFDNFDFHQRVHHMTESHQNIDKHWVGHMSTENRVSGNHLSIEPRSKQNILEMDNGKFIPDSAEHVVQRENYASLVSRIIVDNINCLGFLKDHVIQHIKHLYSREMAKPTDTMFLGMIFENENTNEGMQVVLDEIHPYVPRFGDEDRKRFTGQGVVGDQLSVERGVNSLMQIANGHTADDRKEGIHFEIADFHAQMKFLQVAFDHFYNTSASSDKCTLYSDRNHINRRNVVAEVDKNFSACKQFFRMEIEARVAAAALDFLQITSLEETPPEESLPIRIVDGTAETQTNFLKDLAFKIVDKYIVNEKNINAIMEELQECSIDVLEDGRFPCRFPGCTKSFAFDGKRRTAHEKTHGLDSNRRNTQRASSNAVGKDDVFNYQLALLEYGMLFLNFSDAISEGDGLRILRCWKYFLLFLKVDGARSRKYALEGLHLISQVYAILPPREAHRLIWNRSVKSKYGMGGNIPLDLALEHYNRVLKEVIKKMGPNASNETAITRFCKCLSVNKQLMDNFDLDCAVLRRSGSHVRKKCLDDFKKIVQELLCNNAFKYSADRSYKYFSGCSSSLLVNFDLHAMFKWINGHKKSIYLKKTAR